MDRPRGLHEGVPGVVGLLLLLDGGGGLGLWCGKLGAVGNAVDQPPVGPTVCHRRVTPPNPEHLQPRGHPCPRPPLCLHPPQPQCLLAVAEEVEVRGARLFHLGGEDVVLREVIHLHPLGGRTPRLALGGLPHPFPLHPPNPQWLVCMPPLSIHPHAPPPPPRILAWIRCKMKRIVHTGFSEARRRGWRMAGGGRSGAGWPCHPSAPKTPSASLKPWTCPPPPHWPPCG